MNSSITAGVQGINPMTAIHENMPSYRRYDLNVSLSEPTEFTINLRIPEWIMSEATIYVNGELQGKSEDGGCFYAVRRVWQDGDAVSLLLPIGIRFVPLPDDESMGAFRFGPEVLAGICESERILYADLNAAASELEMENEREWGSWRYFFKTANQDPAISFRRLRDIGYEPYQIYFKVKQAR